MPLFIQVQYDCSNFVVRNIFSNNIPNYMCIGLKKHLPYTIIYNIFVIS